MLMKRHLKNKAIIRHNQHGLMKGRYCLSNLVSFCDKVTLLVEGGKAADVIFLNFNTAFDNVPRSLFLDKLSNFKINRFMLCWVLKWLDNRAQRVVVNGTIAGWQPVTSSDQP